MTDDLRARLVHAIREAVRIAPFGPNSRKIHDHGGSVCLTFTEAEQAADAAFALLAPAPASETAREDACPFGKAECDPLANGCDGECDGPAPGIVKESPIRALSDLIDSTYAKDVSPEAHLWRRCAKVTEENGEVTEALLGVMGENPRKGKTHNLLHVRAELLDVALAALGAVAHIERDADPIDALREHADDVLARLRAAVPAPTPPTTVQADRDAECVCHPDECLDAGSAGCDFVMAHKRAEDRDAGQVRLTSDEREALSNALPAFNNIWTEWFEALAIKEFERILTARTYAAPDRPPRAIPGDATTCTCGHPSNDHDMQGCRGTGRSGLPCACRRFRVDLNAEVER